MLPRYFICLWVIYVSCGWAGCLTDLASSYCALNDIIYMEQKGARKGCWGVSEENNRSDLRCYSCLDAKDPMSCNAYEICGAGEECFTRKFTDHLGRAAFRLGCESKMLCNLYKSALTIVGKRSIEDDSQDNCFDCCDADSCNVNMCGGNATQQQTTPPNITVTLTETTPASTTAETTTPPPPKCPHTYLTGPGSCYLLVNSSHTWHEGDVLCKQMGDELMSINDKTEDDFISNYLNTLAGSSQPDGYWVGGFFDKSTSQWEWQDGTHMTYVRWGPHQPVSFVNYHVNLFNPRVSAMYNNWKWSTNVEYASNRWLICERSFN